MKKILVSRTDAIGDVVLTLPMVTLIKQADPNVHITFLGRSYTEPVLRCCRSVDDFLNWDDLARMPFTEAVETLSAANFSAVLHVFPRREIARLCAAAKIPIRAGTSHRLYHWWYCNRRPNLTRRNSQEHEAELNILLAKKSGFLSADLFSDLSSDQYFKAADSAQFGLSVEKLWPMGWSPASSARKVILHPGGKSARSWPLSHFEKLARQLVETKYEVFVTGSAQEGEAIKAQWNFAHPNLKLTMGQFQLSELMGFIASVDALVAPSTGPLHLAAALGKIAIGIYPPIAPIHPGRWRPLGPRAYVLSRTELANCRRCVRKPDNCLCMSEILPEQVFSALRTAFDEI